MVVLSSRLYQHSVSNYRAAMQAVHRWRQVQLAVLLPVVHPIAANPEDPRWLVL
jgi:hypothetical protein